MNRSGFALLLVIATITLGGILVTGTFLIGRLESQSGHNGMRSAKAFAAAEAGLARGLEGWTPALESLAVGDSIGITSGTVSTASWQAAARRLGDDLFWLQAEGWLSVPGVSWRSSRRLAQLVRWTPLLPVPATVTAVDSVVWSGGGPVTGYSRAGAPAGWGACPPDSAPGLRLSMSAIVKLPGCTGSCLLGWPPVRSDSAVVSVRSAIAPLNYDSLAAQAGRRLSSDPYPVFRAPGDTAIMGGSGRGILLVDGDLTLGGGTQFTGLIVVLGNVIVAPGGAVLTGSLYAGSVVVSPLTALSIDYSACVLRKVLRGPTRAIPLQSRSWAQLY